MKAPTSQDNLWVAAGDGQLDRVRELIDNGMDINSRDQFGYTAMHAAVSYNQREIAEYLIKEGANVNIEDFEKDTPLFVAETVEMAQLLLDHGADPKHKNEEGITPALTAFEEGWQEVAELLANITNEKLPTEEEDTVDDSLAHVVQDDDQAERPSAATETTTTNTEDGELSEDLSNQIQDIMKRIEEQGGVDNEEELQEMVAKMLLDEMRRKANE